MAGGVRRKDWAIGTPFPFLGWELGHNTAARNKNSHRFYYDRSHQHIVRFTVNSITEMNCNRERIPRPAWQDCSVL